jgi:hypothetical protein
MFKETVHFGKCTKLASTCLILFLNSLKKSYAYTFRVSCFLLDDTQLLDNTSILYSHGIFSVGRELWFILQEGSFALRRESRFT